MDRCALSLDETMASTDRKSKEVSALLEEIDPPQREVAHALREVILETGFGLQEKVRYGVPWYRGKNYVLAIAAHSNHTNLEFYRGSSLRDPARVLEGTGKNMRHVKVRTVADAKHPRLQALLREAIALDLE